MWSLSWRKCLCDSKSGLDEAGWLVSLWVGWLGGRPACHLVNLHPSPHKYQHVMMVFSLEPVSFSSGIFQTALENIDAKLRFWRIVTASSGVQHYLCSPLVPAIWVWIFSGSFYPENDPLSSLLQWERRVWEVRGFIATVRTFHLSFTHSHLSPPFKEHSVSMCQAPQVLVCCSVSHCRLWGQLSPIRSFTSQAPFKHLSIIFFFYSFTAILGI